jgi:superfamily II DNA or RNA helicase
MQPHHTQLLPSGHLVLTEGEGLPKALVRAFSSSTAEGLLALATEAFEDALTADLAFWRMLAHDFLTRLCQAPSATEWLDVPRPTEDELAAFVAKAPLVPGMEYLKTEIVVSLWAGLNAAVARASVASEGGLDAWLRERNPVWRLVGRVSFHLAENKRNELFPFAFLATYTHKLSSQAQLQYLPLGKALKEYAGKKDTRRLKSLLEPVQAAALASDFARELLDSRRVFHALAWSPSEAHQFVSHIPVFEDAGIIVKVPDWWKGGRPSRATVSVALDTGKDKTSVGLDSLVSFKVGLAVDGEKISKEEWEKILASSENLVSLKGRWVEVDRTKLQQMLDQWQRAESAASSGALTFLQGMRMLAGFQMGATGLEDLDEALQGGGEWLDITASGRLKELLAQIRDPSKVEDISTDGALKASLRRYQQDGLNWLHLMHGLGLGACLADDMGLGKTIQVIALLLKIRNKKKQPVLLVVPASLVGNWRAEIEKFAPSLDVFYAHPSQVEREALKDIENQMDRCDAVITTYSMLGRLSSLSEAHWNIVVLDEAQAIKNPRSMQTRAVKALQARQRIALTGTPVENNVGDLWSLFDFINPGLLGTAKRFSELSASLTSKSGPGYGPLRNLVSPYILRRLKTDKSIISDLPDKTEVRTNCSLTKGQAALYKKSVEQLKKDIESAEEGIDRSGLVLSYLMRFKQICDHPALWTGSGNFGVKDSGKYKRLQSICEEIRDRGEKVLVFTQFKEMTGPLAEFLGEIFGRPGLVLHGGTAVKRRQKLVTEFQKETGPPFFVISLKAGGTGLNLTAASHVIHFDRWWNPAVENQATDRAFRIGQKRNVLVHKFVCAGTIEEKIDVLISEKQELADEILGTGAERKLTSMSNAELLEFVRLDIDSAVF